MPVPGHLNHWETASYARPDGGRQGKAATFRRTGKAAGGKTPLLEGGRRGPFLSAYVMSIGGGRKNFSNTYFLL